MRRRGRSGLKGVERRDFLKIFSIGTVAAMSGQLAHRSMVLPESVPFEDMDTSIRDMANSIELMSTPAPNSVDFLNAFRTNQIDLAGTNKPTLATTSSPDLGHYIAKMTHFEHNDWQVVSSFRYRPTLHLLPKACRPLLVSHSCLANP